MKQKSNDQKITRTDVMSAAIPEESTVFVDGETSNALLLDIERVASTMPYVIPQRAPIKIMLRKAKMKKMYLYTIERRTSSC